MEEAAPVTAATGALGPVVDKLSTLRRRRGEYQLRCRTRKDVKLIRSKLKSIHSILWEIWEREDLDAAGKELRMEAWRLTDDMNDAIDDFILTMKRSSDGKRFMEDKTTQPSRPFGDLKKRAYDVSVQCQNKWKTETSNTVTVSSLFSRKKTTVDSGPAWRHRVVDPYVHKDISELVGMREPRDELTEHLVGKEDNTPEVKMASILGATGMGKTTLARLVYEAIQDKFQARAFVSITSSRNMTKVLASILRQLAVDSTVVLLDSTKAATKNEHLIDIISSFLKDKRYLVIIDDVWHSSEWETVKQSLPENYLGSRVVTTCRVNAITDKWRDDFDALVHEIDHSQDRWYGSVLTNKMIDMNYGDMVGEGFDLDHPIVKMCRGMPLTVACMFSALAEERERQEQQRMWLCIETRDLQDRIEEQVTRNGIQNTRGFEPLVESFELGYNHLPHHMLKTCLLYCSIYPNLTGLSFTRGDLFRRWIAQGFVCQEEVAKDYFDELASRGFITNGLFHPMMQNYLRCKLREHNFITCSSDIPSSPVGRLCIDYWPATASSDAVDTLSGIDDWHHIRSLVVFKDAERVPYKHLENLRVLDVQHNLVLENQHLKDMCRLLRLRHLFVSGDFGREGAITEIPAEIARLQHLETLDVCGTGIRRLPAEIGDVKQLKTLNVSSNRELAELAREIGNLQHLETLIIRFSKIREQAWEIVGTLKKLKTLDLSRNPRLSGIPRDIGELQQLRNLDVSFNHLITELPKEIWKLQYLETLNLSATGITELPREIGNLQRLQILNLNQVTITKLPRDIGKLQHLEALHLRLTNVRKIPREIGELKKLKNLDAELGTLPFEAGQLSKFEGLPKCVRQAWKNSDLVSSLAGEILCFSKTGQFTGGDGGLIVGTKHLNIPQWIKEHFNNIAVLDIRICKLEEQDLKILREMPTLGWLTLRFEAVPRKPIAISSGGFAMLLYLIIESRVPRITFQEGAMPRLVSLYFEFQFYGGPPDTDTPMSIKHLVSLEEVNFQCKEWYRGDSPCISATIDVMRKEARENPNGILLEFQARILSFFQRTVLLHKVLKIAMRLPAAVGRKRSRRSRAKLNPSSALRLRAPDHYDLDLHGGDFHHVYVYLLDIFYSKGIHVITSLISIFRKMRAELSTYMSSAICTCSAVLIILVYICCIRSIIR